MARLFALFNTIISVWRNENISVPINPTCTTAPEPLKAKTLGVSATEGSGNRVLFLDPVPNPCP